VRQPEPASAAPGPTRAIAIVVVAAVLTPGTALAAASNTVELRADAGLGGFARPGRWTPVRIELDNRIRDLAGDVVVEWGDTRLHRAIDLPAPSRTAFELYVRTTDARASMVVQVIENGATAASIELPVRIVPEEDALIVCAGADQPDGGDVACTTTMPVEHLPQSLRGYFAASDIRLPPGAEARLTSLQRTALQRWRAYRAMALDDGLTHAPRAPLSAATPTHTGRPARIAAAMAIASAICSAAVWILAGGSAARSYAALGAATLAGLLAATFSGRFGPGSGIVVSQATTVEQIGDGSRISMRGTIEYPAFADYAVRLSNLDGDVTARGVASTEHWQDGAGLPVRRGTFGRGALEEIEADGVTDYAPFEISTDGDVVRVRNRSDATLIDCSFPEGFADRHAGILAPGGEASARARAPGNAPFFSCDALRSPVAFSERHFAVRVEGTTLVSVRLPDRSRQGNLE
jgi:hypothetical protein